MKWNEDFQSFGSLLVVLSMPCLHAALLKNAKIWYVAPSVEGASCRAYSQPCCSHRSLSLWILPMLRMMYRVSPCIST